MDSRTLQITGKTKKYPENQKIKRKEKNPALRDMKENDKTSHFRSLGFGIDTFPNLLNNTSNSRFFLILSAFFGFRPVLPILNKTIKYRISFVHGVTL